MRIRHVVIVVGLAAAPVAPDRFVHRRPRPRPDRLL